MLQLGTEAQCQVETAPGSFSIMRGMIDLTLPPR
jgi:hypothetical protein